MSKGKFFPLFLISVTIYTHIANCQNTQLFTMTLCPFKYTGCCLLPVFLAYTKMFVLMFALRSYEKQALIVAKLLCRFKCVNILIMFSVHMCHDQTVTPDF